MAPLQGKDDDETGLDFFDNLILGDESVSIRSDVPNANDGLEAELANMSIEDVGTILEDETAGENSKKNADHVSNPASLDVPVDSVDSTPEAGCLPASDKFKDRGSGVLTVKEAQWSDFITGSNYGEGKLGSTSDFFSEFPDVLREDVIAKSGANCQTEPLLEVGGVGLASVGSNLCSDHRDLDFVDSNFSSDHDQVFECANQQDVYNSQYWESLYPGWCYDSGTGQWYQIDGYQITTATQENSNSTQIEGNAGLPDLQSGISYSQQTSPCVAGTSNGTASVSAVTNWNAEYQSLADYQNATSSSTTSIWNEASQGAVQYPENMLFDPQYPGWYYDTIVQEWCSLESYVPAGRRENETHNLYNSVTSNNAHSLYNGFNQMENHTSYAQGDKSGNLHDSAIYYSHQNAWKPEDGGILNSSPKESNTYTSAGHVDCKEGNQVNYKALQNASRFAQQSTACKRLVDGPATQSFVPVDNSYQHDQKQMEKSQQLIFTQNYYGSQMSDSYLPKQVQTGVAVYDQRSCSYTGEKSSAGRPPHALVSFGFGGKLVVMKTNNRYGLTSNCGGQVQDPAEVSVSVLNLAEVMKDKNNDSSAVYGACDYLDVLCQKSFPGPLVGGYIGNKEVHKWIDDRIANCAKDNLSSKEGELTRLLFSLLKISCQQYGKLRSPFGVDTALQEADNPESAVTKLFAAARGRNGQLENWGTPSNCVQNLSSEAQMQAAAIEVQNLLVSGRKKEALSYAQEGQLWGFALVLAAQLGEQSYIETMKQMARHQFVPGSPLRTLCLLIAGEPADVFAMDNSVNLQVPTNPFQHPLQIHSMLDAWEENLAIITANRTKDDELVIIHLGDCLWRERGEIIAAHICYLVAEANFESYSDTARLCLVGADHLKFPRTYASPGAIQRTELYEYSKLLGNSQYALLPFQPYKLIYAYMLAEVGKISESLKYCQAILKTLKSPVRAAEVETWRSLVVSLEERIRIHQQGGYGTSLAPGKLVDKLFTSFDKISRMIGAPPPIPSQNAIHANDSHATVSKVVTSQSSLSMSPLLPSASMEPISTWISDTSKMTMHNRSISEPDFARSPKQVDRSKGPGSDSKTSVGNASSRFGRIGSQILQKTVGWVSRTRSDRQAKLGETNKFYYDETLKRWVEEGAEIHSEAALPAPPTTAALQNGTPGCDVNSNSTDQVLPTSCVSDSSTPVHGSGIPPMPPSSNQFSARGRMTVRSRYVDTFNKGSVTPTNLFHSPSVPVTKVTGSTKFFVPPQQSSPTEQAVAESIGNTSMQDRPSTSGVEEPSFPMSTTSSIQRFPSMDYISPGSKNLMTVQSSTSSLHSRTRSASWSGTHTDMQRNDSNSGEVKLLQDGPGKWTHSTGSSLSLGVSNGPSLQMNCSLGSEDYQDVDL